MEAGFGSTMPRYSEPSAYPRSIEVLGEHGLDLVAVMHRGASVGHDDFALVEAFKNFRRGVGHQSHPNGQMVNGGTWNRDAAAALGVDAGAGEHADLERRIVAERYPDTAKLGGAIDLGRNQPHAPDQIGRIVEIGRAHV